VGFTGLDSTLKLALLFMMQVAEILSTTKNKEFDECLSGEHMKSRNATIPLVSS